MERKWWTLLVVCVATFMLLLDITIVNVALPTIAHDLKGNFSDIQWGDIQPRLGIAYQLNDKTVLRAGGGRFITRLGVSDSVFLGGNPPFQPNASVSFGSVDNPGAGGAASIPLVVTTQSKAFKNPEAWNWNLTFERQMFWKSLLSVGYVGRRGLHFAAEPGQLPFARGQDGR